MGDAGTAVFVATVGGAGAAVLVPIAGGAGAAVFVIVVGGPGIAVVSGAAGGRAIAVIGDGATGGVGIAVVGAFVAGQGAGLIVIFLGDGEMAVWNVVPKVEVADSPAVLIAGVTCVCTVSVGILDPALTLGFNTLGIAVSILATFSLSAWLLSFLIWK